MKNKNRLLKILLFSVLIIASLVTYLSYGVKEKTTSTKLDFDNNRSRITEILTSKSILLDMKIQRRKGNYDLLHYYVKGDDIDKLNVYDDSHWIQPQELIILLPGQFVSFTEASDDFLTTTLVVSPTMFSDALSGVPRFSPHFFFYMRTHYWYPQTENDTRRLMNFFGMVKDKVTSNDIYRRELIIHLLRYLYLELFNAYEKEASLMTTRKDTRKEELANKFFGLIMKHFKENKDVAFYADKLCITSKYLTMVIKEVSGKSAKDWIVEYIVLEIKALLKNTNMNIQEIAVKTNFANQSSLGRFFRKHTGMSLSQYRMSNLG